MPIDPSNTYGGRKAVTPLLRVTPKPTIPSAPTQRKPRFDEEPVPEIVNPYFGVNAGRGVRGFNPMVPTTPGPTMYPGRVPPTPIVPLPGVAPTSNYNVSAYSVPRVTTYAPESTYVATWPPPQPAVPATGQVAGYYNFGGGGGGGSRKTAMNVGLVNWRI